MKETTIITNATNLISSIYTFKFTDISPDIRSTPMNNFPSWPSSEKPLCTYTVWYRLLIFSYATLTAHHCT